MGRGRQKAKQTKVARKLKYYSPDTDLEALARELRSAHKDSVGVDGQVDDFDDEFDYEDDDYSRYDIPPAYEGWEDEWGANSSKSSK